MFSLGPVRRSCSPEASSALEAHPIKELPGHGGLFLAETAPASPLPAPPAAHILLPKFRFSILPLKPLGEQKRNPRPPLAGQGPDPGTLGMGPQPPRPPAPARPRGSWKGGGDGAETGWTGTGQDGCSRGTTCSCLRSLQRGGDASGAAAACRPRGERWPQGLGIIQLGLGGMGRANP